MKKFYGIFFFEVVIGFLRLYFLECLNIKIMFEEDDFFIFRELCFILF